MRICLTCSQPMGTYLFTLKQVLNTWKWFKAIKFLAQGYLSAANVQIYCRYWGKKVKVHLCAKYRRPGCSRIYLIRVKKNEFWVSFDSSLLSFWNLIAGFYTIDIDMTGSTAGLTWKAFQWIYCLRGACWQKLIYI